MKYKRSHELIASRIRPVELALLLKKIMGIKRGVHTLENGVKLFLDPATNFGLRILKEGGYEPASTNAVLRLLGEGDTFVDLGANEGYFSVLAARRVGKTGRVLSIEPQQRIWPVLEKNFELNACGNATIIPVAVGENEEELVINLYPSINTGASSLSNESNFGRTKNNLRKRFFGTQRVQVKRLDTLDKQYQFDHIKLLKVDIEGFEFFALRSGESLLKNKRISHLLMEFHPPQLKDLGQSESQIIAYLASFGYYPSETFADVFSFRN